MLTKSASFTAVLLTASMVLHAQVASLTPLGDLPTGAFQSEAHGVSGDGSVDLEFRDRMKRAYLIAMLVTINIRWRLEHIRVAKIFMDQHELYVWGPRLVAVTAFLYGREYGRWESGAIEQIPMVDADDTAALIKGRPDLREQLKEVREIAAEGVRKVAETLQYAVGYAHATEVLSQWEGFGRFCRQHLGLEPLTVMSAYKLCGDDPAAEVLASYADAKVDEGMAAHWEGNWAREWGRRFN